MPSQTPNKQRNNSSIYMFQKNRSTAFTITEPMNRNMNHSALSLERLACKQLIPYNAPSPSASSAADNTAAVAAAPSAADRLAPASNSVS